VPDLRPKPNSTPDDVAFGINACAMAMRAGAAKSLSFLDGTRNDRVLELVVQARAMGLAVQAVDIVRLDQLTGGGVHQGVLVRLRAMESFDLDSLANDKSRPSLVLLLDSITDPQNVGAVLRSAVAVGVHAVVLPHRRGALLTPGVHRASAGISFVAPVAAPTNLARAVRDLKGAGYWIVAADGGSGSVDATSFDWPKRVALVLGSEGQGIGRLLRELSDFVVRLPMDTRVESLNVAVACGALSYLWRRQWPT
jgi:23S rRNA (guanosine2251-2'-O)-methyltransferase